MPGSMRIPLHELRCLVVILKSGIVLKYVFALGIDPRLFVFHGERKNAKPFFLSSVKGSGKPKEMKQRKVPRARRDMDRESDMAYMSDSANDPTKLNITLFVLP